MHARETTTLICTSRKHLKLLPFWGLTTGDNSNRKLPVVCLHPTAIRKLSPSTDDEIAKLLSEKDAQIPKKVYQISNNVV